MSSRTALCGRYLLSDLVCGDMYVVGNNFYAFSWRHGHHILLDKHTLLLFLGMLGTKAVFTTCEGIVDLDNKTTVVCAVFDALKSVFNV